MTQSDVIWLSLIAAGAAFESYALRSKQKGDTLSETTRSVFRTKTSRVGRVTFGVAWISFSAWYFAHILWEVPFPGF